MCAFLRKKKSTTTTATATTYSSENRSTPSCGRTTRCTVLDPCENVTLKTSEATNDFVLDEMPGSTLVDRSVYDKR